MPIFCATASTILALASVYHDTSRSRGLSHTIKPSPPVQFRHAVDKASGIIPLHRNRLPQFLLTPKKHPRIRDSLRKTRD
ncbi:hypothetical protein ACFLYF_01855 [Chloroflexota bacterium]